MTAAREAASYEDEDRLRQTAELIRSNEMQDMRQRWLWSVLAGSLVLLAIAMSFLLHLRRSRAALNKLNASLEKRIGERTYELQHSRQLLAEAQRITHVGSWELDHLTKRLTWSDEVYRIFEIEPAQFGGNYQAFLDAVHPEDRARIDDLFNESLRNRTPYETEHRLQLPQGRVKYVQERCETDYAPDGMPLRSIGTVQDITERKEAEQKLKESLEFSEGIINAIPDMLFEVDRDGRYLNVWTQNPELLAAQKEQLLGKTAAEVLSPENAAAAMRAIGEADVQGASRIEDISIDLPMGKRWFSHSLSKKPGGAPGEATFLVLSRDITERKQLEEQLAIREREFRRLADNLPDNIARWDCEGRYLYVNPTHEHTLGKKVQDLVGQFIPDSHDRVIAGIKQVVATGTGIHALRQSAMVAGEEVLHDVSLVPEFDADGRVVSVLGIGRDMTERYRMQEALVERERELRALAESSPGMMGSFLLRVDGKICMPYVSPNISDLFGLQPSDVAEDAAPLMKLTHPDDAQRVNDTIAESASKLTLWHEEYRILHPKKGERWMESNTSPQRRPDGGTIWYGYIHDITARKCMEAKLKESEARYRYNSNLLQAIIESPSSSVSIYAIDRDYRLLAFNRRFKDAAKRLWKADIEPGMSMLEVIDNEPHRAFFKQGADHVLAGNDGYLESSEVRIENGREVREWHDNYGSPIREDSGSVIGVTLFVLNTTERKEAEQKLKEALEFSEGIINAIPDILFEMDVEGRYLNVWTHTPELLAAQREALLGKTVSEVLLPESEATIMAALREAEELGVAFGRSIRIDLPKGESWFEISVSKKPGSTSSANTFLVLSRDITVRRRMESALLESESLARSRSDLLSAIMESSPEVIVFALDAEYRYQAFNSKHRETMLAIWGKKIENGMNMLDVISLDSDRETAKQGFDRALAGESFVEEKAYGDEKLKREYWQNFYSPIRSETGDVTGLTCFVLNITGRMRMEVILSESEARLRALIDNLPFEFWAMDNSLRYIMQNSTSLKNHGNLVDKRIEDLNFPLELAASRIAQNRKVLAGQMSQEEYEKEVEGERRYYENMVAPVLLCDTVIGIVGVGIDITARKRMEAELRASRNFLDSVIDSVSDPLFVKDRQHRWTLLNDAFCAFIGHPRADLLGRSDYDFFPQAQADVFWEKDESVFNSGEVNLNEERFTSANGETHFIQTKKTPFVSAKGEQMLVGVIRDITERQRFEDAREAALIEAQRLAKLRSDFIAHMSHELRTPLNGILGYAQMLERDGKLGEKQLASVEVIRHSGEHLLSLIEDILDLARIESGKLELHLSDIPLRHFLQVIEHMIAIRAREKHLECAVEITSDLPEGIRGDEKRLRQVLLNLLSNAVKFTDQGRVTLNVSRVSRSRLSFTVSDTGIGIAAVDIEAIFQPFEQVGDIRHRDGGTGLGLSISRQLIRLMGGEIAVESQLGEGSRFRFELELPEVEIGDAQQGGAGSGQVETREAEHPATPLIPPPEAEMRELHRLALLGNMRDIVDYAVRIGDLDPCYQPFARQLKQLAEAFKSKAILTFVERYLQ